MVVGGFEPAAKLNTMKTVDPFRIQVSDSELDDLRRRLRATRWPEEETGDGWSQGVPRAYLQDVARYWADEYDWRAREARINAFPQFRLRLADVGIHFIHLRSSRPDALPLLMTHGWPGSIVEFLKVLRPLAEPQEHGGEARDAFHIVCPALPGYGFSAKPAGPGCGVEKIAALWDELMLELGYASYVAQGGDWGAAVTTEIGVQNLGHCRAIHLNMPLAAVPPSALTNPTPADTEALELQKRYGELESGYAVLQATRPQTLGYSLADSPVGQASWILEKFFAWTDCNGHPENILTRDELLDNVMLYWLPCAGASSARLYAESFRRSFRRDQGTITLPTGCSIYPKELSKPPRAWVEQRYPHLIHWNELPRGGHFAAFEQPELFVQEIRTCFSHVR
jgi:pimeloyl-ACP methyl ester carboxylesterase